MLQYRMVTMTRLVSARAAIQALDGKWYAAYAACMQPGSTFIYPTVNA